MNRAIGFAALLALACTQTAQAQAWPAKPIRMIVANSAGSGTDILFRTAAPRLGEALGQPIVVENRTSAGGILAMESVAQAPADGYMLLGSAGTNIVVGPLLFKHVAELMTKLVPIAPTARTKVLLVSRPGLPVGNVGELVQYARSHPGKLNFGSAGVTTLSYIQGEMLLHAANLRAVHVPYKNAGQSLLLDMVGERIDFTFDAGTAIPYIKAGKLRLLGVVGSERSPFFPQAPTLAEGGIDIAGSPPQGVYAPAALPATIGKRLHEELRAIVGGEEMRTALNKLGAEPVLTDSAAQFAAMLERDRERFRAIVREAHIEIE